MESLYQPVIKLILLAGLGALFLVRTPIAALALHRAIADAAAAVAKFQSTGDMRLRFGAEMARFDTGFRGRCSGARVIVLLHRHHRRCADFVLTLLRRGRNVQCIAAIARRLVTRPIGQLALF